MKTVNKYVACKPNLRNKQTTIERGDLPDHLQKQLNLAKWRIEELSELLFKEHNYKTV